MRCQCILKTGKNSDKQCTYQAKQFSTYCGIHTNCEDSRALELIGGYSPLDYTRINEGKWTTLDLTGGYENFGGNYFDVQCKRMNNIVYFRGLMKSKNTPETWTVISIVPNQLRPLKDQIFSVTNNDKNVAISIRKNGLIQIRPGTAAGTISLDGVFYHMD